MFLPNWTDTNVMIERKRYYFIIGNALVIRNFVKALRKLIKKYSLDIPEEEMEFEIENVMLRIFEGELAGREKEKN